MKTRFWKTLFAPIVLTLSLMLPAIPAAAATTQITGGTNGSSCNSGGYFTPSSVTISSGNTVTFSVPLNDPYSGGMEIIGFPQGHITIARGGSATTAPLTANVSYHGTWPNSPSCLKGSGTITVSAPAPPPPASGGSSSSSSGSSSSSSSKPASTPAKTPASSSTSTSTQPTTEPATTAPTDTQSTTSSPTKKSQSSSSHSGTSDGGPTVVASSGKSPALANVATFGGGGLAVIAIGLFIAWRLLARRRLRAIPVQSSPVQPSEAPAIAPASETSAVPQISEVPTGQTPAEPQGEDGTIGKPN